MTIFAASSHASPPAQSPGTLQRLSESAASNGQGTAQLAWAASLHDPHAGDAAQLRTSDSVDSIELLQGGARLTPGRSGSSGSAVCSRGSAGSARRRQPPDNASATAGSAADQHDSRSRSSCADSGGATSAHQTAAMRSANGTDAALSAATSPAESPAPAAPPSAALLPSPFALEGVRRGSGGGMDGDSDGNSDYETASEEGGAGLDRAHFASPSRLKCVS